jgi:hypothetical protein
MWSAAVPLFTARQCLAPANAANSSEDRAALLVADHRPPDREPRGHEGSAASYGKLGHRTSCSPCGVTTKFRKPSLGNVFSPVERNHAKEESHAVE